MDTLAANMTIEVSNFGTIIVAIIVLTGLLATLFVGYPRDLKDAHATRAEGKELSRNQKILIYGRLPVTLVLIGIFVLIIIML